MARKYSSTPLKQEQAHNFWVYIQKQHKILLVSHSFSFIQKTLKQVKNEQKLCPETLIDLFCKNQFFSALEQKVVQNFWAHIRKEQQILNLAKCF